jgi:hypothetical protein
MKKFGGLLIGATGYNHIKLAFSFAYRMKLIRKLNFKIKKTVSSILVSK